MKLFYWQIPNILQNNAYIKQFLKINVVAVNTINRNIFSNYIGVIT